MSNYVIFHLPQILSDIHSETLRFRRKNEFGVLFLSPLIHSLK